MKKIIIVVAIIVTIMASYVGFASMHRISEITFTNDFAFSESDQTYHTVTKEYRVDGEIMTEGEYEIWCKDHPIIAKIWG